MNISFIGMVKENVVITLILQCLFVYVQWWDYMNGFLQFMLYVNTNDIIPSNKTMTIETRSLLLFLSIKIERVSTCVSTVSKVIILLSRVVFGCILWRAISCFFFEWVRKRYGSYSIWIIPVIKNLHSYEKC